MANSRATTGLVSQLCNSTILRTIPATVPGASPASFAFSLCLRPFLGAVAKSGGGATNARVSFLHDLREREVGVRTLADPIKVDSSNPDDPMAQLSVVILSLFGQMERTYAIERAAHARAVATAKGKQVGRPSVVDPAKLRYAEHLRNEGYSMREIVEETGIARTSLYRHLPPRPVEAHTVEGQDAAPGDG
ncbi:recombinase family protein [Corynebacterium glutamicum]|uniref:recombinase family protein n=1 Tax=Corynebacterium glutamicum TaxID=1718 RepID=UPI0021B13DC7|nr:recombinase family protein [Corynebacterium glutamicum]